jgi:hypothetical protein
MPQNEYFVFTVGDDPKAGTIENLDSKVQKYWLLSKGVRMGELFPPSVELNLSRDGGTLLTDFLDNIHSVVIVSARARAILEQEGLDDQKVEYLPFVLRDKRRKKVPEQYFIANVLESVDCFDWERSVYKTFPDSNEISYPSLRKLHVREDQIPETARFFRLGALKKKILIRSDLLERLRAEGCTGINVLAMGATIP